MIKNYKVLAPPQKYLELPIIYTLYGSRPVIAYNCKVGNGAPYGGFVIAVQNDADGPTEGIKAYMAQLKERYFSREPIYYICVKENVIVYDMGKGEVETLPDIIEKKPSKAQQAVESIPDEVLAQILSAVFRQEDTQVQDPQ